MLWGGLPLLRHGEHLTLTWQANVAAGYQTRNLLIAKRIRYPLHHRGCTEEHSYFKLDNILSSLISLILFQHVLIIKLMTRAIGDK